jgi:hypothetical protein
VPKPTVTTNSSVSRDDPELSGIVTAGASAGGATGGKNGIRRGRGDGAGPKGIPGKGSADGAGVAADDETEDLWRSVLSRFMSWLRTWRSNAPQHFGGGPGSPQTAGIVSLLPEDVTVGHWHAVNGVRYTLSLNIIDQLCLYIASLKQWFYTLN